MKGKQPASTAKRAPKEEPRSPITVTGVRQGALESFAGSIAQVTAIANGICHVTLRERCEKCGHEPTKTAPTPEELFKLVPRPSEITAANALLAKISLPAQTESLGLAEGQALIEATIGRFHASVVAHGVPKELADRWFHEARQPMHLD